MKPHILARFKTMGNSNQRAEIPMGQLDSQRPADTFTVNLKNPQQVDEKPGPASEKKEPQQADPKEASGEQICKFSETFRSGLDDIIQVNTIFGSAVFIGLSFSYMTTTLETRQECKPGDGIAEWLVVFEITAFGFFLLSTLLGKALKVHLYITKKEHTIIQTACRVRLIMCGVSTMLGSIFLYLSMINVLQMRLGKLTCRGHVWIAAGSLSFLYFLALLLWVPSLVYVSAITWNEEW